MPYPGKQAALGPVARRGKQSRLDESGLVDGICAIALAEDKVVGSVYDVDGAGERRRGGDDLG